MNRRDFLHTAPAALALASSPRAAFADEVGEIMTVSGPIPADRLGTTLPHEHVLVDFIGAAKVSPDRYKPDEVAGVALPHLRKLREAGCAALFECTPAYLGRDPRLLKRLAEASGLKIVTNAGYYGAGGGKYLPAHAHAEDADQLAARWLAEWRDGIDGTGIRPGFLKIGMDAGPPKAVDAKLIRAAARTHLRSGLTIAVHTGDGAAALGQLEILREEGVDPSAWVWVHAQNEQDPAIHLQAAGQGAWVEFDGVGPQSLDRHVELVRNLKARDLLHRALISQDAGWYNVGTPGGGDFRPYDFLFAEFLPALKAAGLSDEEIRRLTATNPAQAFAIRIRKLARR